MRETTITKLINHLQEVLKQNISLNAYAEQVGLPQNYFWVKKQVVNKDIADGSIDKESYDMIMSLYDKVSKRGIIRHSKLEEVTSSEEEETSTGKITLVRNDEGKIVKYQFTIPLRDKAPFTGSLTRDEMNMIHRLYSYYGSSITQREVSRSFPEYSLEEFKKILKVFNITKAAAPFAPHVIEENTIDELKDMQLREKENDFLRGIEAERIKNNERLLKKYAMENAELKAKIADGKALIEGLDFNNLYDWGRMPTISNGKDLIIWLSDIHTGATVSPLSIYQNPYNEEEMKKRFDMIIKRVYTEAYYIGGGFENIVICNLGDSLDGYNGQTTRGGHELAQNMNNKEQLQTYIKLMTSFVKSLIENVKHTNMYYYCVGESNHDGDFGYAANLALAAVLEQFDVKCQVFDKFIGEFTLNETTYVMCHGKDNKDMFKNLPLTLDVKTENFINEYLDNKGITGNVVFVKGDLHQSATTYGRRFTYKSVGSLFGSSEWIHKNFGNTCWSCDYSIVDEAGNRLDGLITAKS